jgi:single-strand DNA-binding protein
VEQYVKKGNKVYVEGKLRTREYEKDGQKKYLTELLVDNMELLTPKGEGGSQQSQAAPVQQQADAQDDSNLPF